MNTPFDAESAGHSAAELPQDELLYVQPATEQSTDVPVHSTSQPGNSKIAGFMGRVDRVMELMTDGLVYIAAPPQSKFVQSAVARSAIRLERVQLEAGFERAEQDYLMGIHRRLAASKTPLEKIELLEKRQGFYGDRALQLGDKILDLYGADPVANRRQIDRTMKQRRAMQHKADKAAAKIFKLR